MRPWIGITTYERHPEHGFTLPAAYVEAVRGAGGIPVLVPPGDPEPAAWLSRLDGLILAGGIDVAPEHYQGSPHPQLEPPNAERDTTELALARAVLDWPHPVLAICRGMQVLNVALGGSLIQHLPDWQNHVDHRDAQGKPVEHGVRMPSGSRLHGLFGQEQLSVVSWHHQGLDRVATGLQVVSWAADGLPEAVEYGDHPWLMGVQWHPEMSPEDAWQQRLFAALVQQAIRMAGPPSPLGPREVDR